ncbi:beta-arrestin-1 isoform X2 [Syngnathoides biaculeatus]|uniref:beta-arrestin-1 isoform X2 n=1 Tax=Syngnathoides biaculeatus TaxID=300417 RepID=UPI002ADDA65F|nr:beta-arrestin-1 isoform X2 [Syngnathoides biaculeatus]
MTVSEPWKAHVVRQLRRRDREQHHSFRELVCAYSRLLDRNSETDPILRGGRRGAAGRLKTTAGELACQVVERQQEVKIKEDILEAQRGRLLQEERHAAAARDARRRLRLGAERLGSENALLKSDYDALLERRSRTERRLHEEDLRGSRLLEDVIARKRQAAARLNLRNDRRSRARDANLQKDLQTAATFEVDVELEPFCLTLPKAKSSSLRKKFADKSQGRPLRSAPDSERSPRILASLRELFERRRGPNALTSEDRDRDPERAVRVPASARVPSRALHVLEAHEEGINTAAFCPGSARLASAGTDRVVKVWHVQAGALRHQSTLDGSTEGLTCVQFDPTGHRILAGSYDKSVLLWHLDRPVAKLTLTGHSRKVTAARFSRHQVVTGSADGTVRTWDLRRAACTYVARSSRAAQSADAGLSSLLQAFARRRSRPTAATSSARKISPSADILTAKSGCGTAGCPAASTACPPTAKSRRWTSAPTAGVCSAAAATTACGSSTSAGGANTAPPSVSTVTGSSSSSSSSLSVGPLRRPRWRQDGR